jgi:diguanylate cyclase (GGDEF)-like protein
MSTLVDVSLNPVTLSFADPAVEKEFRDGERARPLAPLRVSLATALVFYAGLGLLDRVLVPGAYRTVWVVRYALICPLLAGMLLLSFAPFFRRLQGVALWLGAGGVGLGLILILFVIPASGSSLYPGCLGLHLVYSCLLLGIRVPAIAGLCAAAAGLYGIMALTTGGGMTRLGDGAWLAAAASMGLAAGYVRERARRAEFLHRRKAERQAGELERAQKEISTLTRVDGLTGLASRDHFFEVAERDLEQCRRYAHPLAIIMLDLDHLRVVNDTCGHMTGDRVLQAVAGQIQYNVREADTAGRLGGEEFVVVLPETDREAALQVGERLRGFVESLRIDTFIGRLSVTVSVGIATVAVPEADTLDDLLSCADKALVAAKRAGRNRVVVWDGSKGSPERDRS